MIPLAAPVCTHCFKPMQKCTEKFDENGKTLYVQYICSCQGTVRYENYHAGDRHKERKDGSPLHQG